VVAATVVVLDPRLPAWSSGVGITDRDDAMAMAGFLNTRIGGGKEIAWVGRAVCAQAEQKALRYLDCWADLAEEQHGRQARPVRLRSVGIAPDARAIVAR
jgi:hypothetical protein